MFDHVSKKMSRDYAKRLTKSIISKKQIKVVDKAKKNEIKDYCKHKFGSTYYWPWLVLYTELRGEFKEGWIPNDYYRFQLLPKLNPEKFVKFSEAKTIDYKIFPELIIEPLFLRLNGFYYDIEGNVKSDSEIQEFLNSINREIIIKPDAGLGGGGIIFKDSKNVSISELPDNENLLFQEVVNQNSIMSTLYPHSINTFRVLTCIDDNGFVNVKFMIIRFGRGGARVDNATGGGGWIFVDSNGLTVDSAYDVKGRFFGKEHPDTGKKFADLKLPFVDKVKKICVEAHYSFPYTRIIGWDVYINENEEPKLIEWNANNPFFWPIEAYFGPFFTEFT